jgi:Na+-translocating membrane potential-generating system (MpsC)
MEDRPGWVFLQVGFFVFRHHRIGGRTIPMTQPHSLAQQIAQTAIAFEEHRLGRRPKSVTVVLGGDTLVIMMHGVLSRAEMALAENPVGTSKLLEFHQELFKHASPITPKAANANEAGSGTLMDGPGAYFQEFTAHGAESCQEIAQPTQSPPIGRILRICYETKETVWLFDRYAQTKQG